MPNYGLRKQSKWYLIQIDASSFAEFEISEFEISRFDCILPVQFQVLTCIVHNYQAPSNSWRCLTGLWRPPISLTSSALGLECANICARSDTCKSVFYIKDNRLCQTHRQTYRHGSHKLTAKPSAIYYEKEGKVTLVQYCIIIHFAGD